MRLLPDYFPERARLLVFCSLLGVWLGLMQTRSPSPDEEGLRRALSARSGKSAGSFVWEPSAGPWLDMLWGRGIIFEAQMPREGGAREGSELSPGGGSVSPGGPRDIFRAVARVSPEGRLLALRRAHNLTKTPRADEHSLTGSTHLAMYATTSHAGQTSMTVLGYGGAQMVAEEGFTAWWQTRLSNWLETRSVRGFRRTDVLPASGSANAILSAQGTQLELTLPTSPTARTTWRLGEMPHPAPRGISIRPRRDRALPWPHFFANTGRKIVGSGLVAWAEGRYFSARDHIRRTGYSITAPASPAAPTDATSAAAAIFRSDDPLWPPAPLSIAGGKPDDGKWSRVDPSLYGNRKEGLFYRTLLHPDAARPYAELHLVAMDMRYLELGIGAGYEDPAPESGPSGSGGVPEEPDIFQRIVATFNGAFKSAHGRYGMKAEGRVLVEPKPGAATVVVDAKGRTGMGTWSAAEATETTRALRQNLSPLVAEGHANPDGRAVWGDHLYGSGVAVERSALCLRKDGQLLYAWATEATGQSLAQGLVKAGCAYAIHLDMNPGHCAFAFNHIESVSPLKAKGNVLDPRMKVNPTRYVRWSPKDFFYLTLRNTSAASVQGTSDSNWQSAPGQTPAPQDIPAVYLKRRSVGGIEIEIDRVELSRFRFRAWPGLSEYEKGAAVLTQSAELEQGFIAWGLGHSTRGTQTGLAWGSRIIRPLRRTYSSLVLRQNSAPELRPPGEPLVETEGQVVVQLPTLARDGQPLIEERELWGKRGRAALCINDELLYIGRITFDTVAPLLSEMLALGCEHVVELDRGSHDEPLTQRAGTERPLRVGQQQTMLYGLYKPMQPRTFFF